MKHFVCEKKEEESRLVHVERKIYENVRRSPRVCSDARSPSKSAHFFLRYPPLSTIGRTHHRRSHVVQLKCFRFFRIQKTEVMLIDDRNIAEIHAMNFFSEVAAAMEPPGRRRRPWQKQLESLWVGNKEERRKTAKKKKIFHLSLERLRLPTHIDSLEEDPVFIPSIRMRFLGNGEVFRGMHFVKLLQIQNCRDTGSGVLWKVSKFREKKKKYDQMMTNTVKSLFGYYLFKCVLTH
ncbi:hypothetical protein CDAR_404501 [Caerostris darwini]|uniref:Uncharacterized protein n=1 Tax=Caerostris darwini TaxID=1538125 RepID=A0AAV4SQ22_9ARAC|nr:hypothetical protein CDAR_404501 [Caerostris darwini]